VNDFGTFALQDAAHDIDGRIMSVKKRSGRYDADFVLWLIIHIAKFEGAKLGQNRAEPLVRRRLHFPLTNLCVAVLRKYTGVPCAEITFRKKDVIVKSEKFFRRCTCISGERTICLSSHRSRSIPKTNVNPT
jgi:hypothetical protein